MDYRRDAYRQQVALVQNDPNTPDYLKVMFQNAMGALYYQSGIETITLMNNQTRTLSPFANMNSTINVDFHAFVGNSLHEAGHTADFRIFPMNIDFDGTQLIQAMLYTTKPVIGQYVTRQQAEEQLDPPLMDKLKTLVAMLREHEGAVSCAGVANDQHCNKSNIVILICKIKSDDNTYICGVPLCKGHTKTQSTNRHKEILAGKRIYLLGQDIMASFNNDDAIIMASDVDIHNEQLLVLDEDE